WRGTSRAAFHEWLARRCLAWADYAEFTQPEYQRSLPAPRAGGGSVVHATWIDETISNPENLWSSKRKVPLRFLFAGRMAAEKGVRTLLEAISLVPDLNATFSFIGAGPELEFVARSNDPRIFVLKPVEYGDPFFKLLSSFMPSLYQATPMNSRASSTTLTLKPFQSSRPIRRA
ncbi:MAG TPA: hypothetical protein VF637_06325, partial [Sphingomicrobium sp.]